MAAFGGFTLTNRGRALQAKAQAGTQLVYTKAMIGDGSITSQSIVALTNLISPKMTLPITGVRPAPPDRAYIESRFNNQSIQTGFYFREIGIYAQDPDVGEIIYAYANAGQNAEYIPPTGGSDIVEKSIRMNVFVGTATNITATIDSSLVFPTYDQVEEMIAAIQIELVDSYESTDKSKAPTADALRSGLSLKQNTIRLADNFLASSVLINAAPEPNTGRAYPDGVSMFKVTSSAGGWPTSNGYVLSFRAGSGGFQMFMEMYTGTTQTDKTARFWTRTKRDSNTFWQPFNRVLTENDLDNTTSSTSTTTAGTADSVRRAKEEAIKWATDNGLASGLVTGNFDNYRSPGTFSVEEGAAIPNFPTGAYNYGVLEVVKSPGRLPMQQVYRAHVGSNVYVRSHYDDGRTWEAWRRLLDDDDYNELFQSVVNGKASVKTAVIGKGGTVSQAGSVPTFAELVAGINGIGAPSVVAGLGQTIFSGAGRQLTAGSMTKFASTGKAKLRGTYRVTFGLRSGSSAGGAGVVGQIYVNGIARGTRRSNDGGGVLANYTEDITLLAGDTIEFWGYSLNQSAIGTLDAQTVSINAFNFFE